MTVQFRNQIMTGLAALLLVHTTQAETPFDHLEPTSTPKVFYPGSVSTEIDKFNTSFSLDLKTIYYTATSRALGISGIAYQAFQQSDFGEPNFVPFVEAEIPVADIQISPDGETLFYSTFKDYDGKADGFHFDIWKSNRSGSGWSNPEPLRSAINTAGNEFYPVLTQSGNFYFNSDHHGQSDIFYSKKVEGVYTAPILLPPEINTDGREADAFVSQDESFMIFVRVDTEDSFGQSDLYISFNLGNGKWTEAKNMGTTINSPAIDGSPYVTPDHKYLIFTTGRKTDNIKERAMSDYSEFKSILNSYQNGNLNFYYVSLDLEKYR